MLKSVGEGETFDLLQDYFYVQELRTKRSPEAGIEREGCFFFFGCRETSLPLLLIDRNVLRRSGRGVDRQGRPRWRHHA